jgi:hypothetical protein
MLPPIAYTLNLKFKTQHRGTEVTEGTEKCEWGMSGGKLRSLH